MIDCLSYDDECDEAERGALPLLFDAADEFVDRDGDGDCGSTLSLFLFGDDDEDFILVLIMSKKPSCGTYH